MVSNGTDQNTVFMAYMRSDNPPLRSSEKGIIRTFLELISGG